MTRPLALIQQSVVRIFDRFLQWQTAHLSRQQRLVFMAFLVGIGTAIASQALKWLIEEIKHILTNSFVASQFNGLYLLYPLVGIMLTSLFIRYIVRDDIGHGVTKILFAISRRQGHIKRHNCWSSVIASSLTIGCGGSVGAESPAVLTGSAIGSTLGNLFRVDQKTLIVLIGCGAAGAISGIFKAPFAGLLFTLEVLMLDLTMASLLPLLVSCVTASVLTICFTGSSSMFSVRVDDFFTIRAVVPTLLLGLFAGLVSLYFTRTANTLEDFFRRFANPYVKFAIGGPLLALLIFIFPPLYGEGYEVITDLINDKGDILLNNSLFYGHPEWLLGILGLIMLAKVFASTFTTSSGGCGGLFAPSLFLGALAGYIFAMLWNQTALGQPVPADGFVLLGMAGAMTAIMHAPLTSVFLIAELTGGYHLFLPLMLVVVSAYLTIIAFERHSIYATRLAKRGQLVTHHKDQAILTLMNLDNVIEKHVMRVDPDTSLGKLVLLMAKEKANAFPVVDGGGTLHGIIYLSNIRNVMFRQELYSQFCASQLMQNPPCALSIDDPMTLVMDHFQRTRAEVLPVLDNNHRFIGFIYQAKLYTAYRQMLVDLSEE